MQQALVHFPVSEGLTVVKVFLTTPTRVAQTGTQLRGGSSPRARLSKAIAVLVGLVLLLGLFSLRTI